MKIGNLDIDMRELAEFLVEAKTTGYASETATSKRLEDGSKEFTFQNGNFHYTDNYAGSSQAPGTEIVRWQRSTGQRIWQMAYSGGMLPGFWANREIQMEVFSFLKRALFNVGLNSPFRGPKVYERDGLRYSMEVRGDLERFSGEERIESSDLTKEFFHKIL